MRHLIYIGILFFLFSCRDDSKQKVQQPVTQAEVKEKLEKANRNLVRNETYEIDNYIKRRGWDMESTGSGLRYMIYYEGDGPEVNDGDFVRLKYSLGLLNGVELYNSDKDGLREFTVGKEEESGLQEGVEYLRQGDKARLIIPPHLGYGLAGDENKIPSRATLIYDLEVLKVDTNQHVP